MSVELKPSSLTVLFWAHAFDAADVGPCNYYNLWDELLSTCVCYDSHDKINVCGLCASASGLFSYVRLENIRSWDTNDAVTRQYILNHILFRRLCSSCMCIHKTCIVRISFMPCMLALVRCALSQYANTMYIYLCGFRLDCNFSLVFDCVARPCASCVHSGKHAPAQHLKQPLNLATKPCRGDICMCIFMCVLFLLWSVGFSQFAALRFVWFWCLYFSVLSV